MLSKSKTISEKNRKHEGLSEEAQPKTRKSYGIEMNRRMPPQRHARTRTDLAGMRKDMEGECSERKPSRRWPSTFESIRDVSRQVSRRIVSSLKSPSSIFATEKDGSVEKTTVNEAKECKKLDDRTEKSGARHRRFDSLSMKAYQWKSKAKSKGSIAATSETSTVHTPIVSESLSASKNTRSSPIIPCESAPKMSEDMKDSVKDKGKFEDEFQLAKLNIPFRKEEDSPTDTDWEQLSLSGDTLNGNTENKSPDLLRFADSSTNDWDEDFQVDSSFALNIPESVNKTGVAVQEQLSSIKNFKQDMQDLELLFQTAKSHPRFSSMDPSLLQDTEAIITLADPLQSHHDSDISLSADKTTQTLFSKLNIPIENACSIELDASILPKLIQHVRYLQSQFQSLLMHS
ncbi:ethanol-hypersensitive mutant protein [Schizosaccharomyces cryophilus OY26]|uniref:Ethanol-hypersensitive mutant protein n=1 Tax=Schizosaccharomyces cryophilus (strain OY26 / ATCC MYA-4695 / CBS 11777 / NBRC 106824 / NRRL Y48691) TaxID=653667 RepID=S9VVS8_SCHCR|nr:ethanol-hypersensitive mutant protein [Schizosaccharomyces cryophilus OY26]EPY50250.1 ethanol-hypersensitive mutant protein [Schizosaccharomyces cryophilus OY26]